MAGRVMNPIALATALLVTVGAERAAVGARRRRLS